MLGYIVIRGIGKNKKFYFSEDDILVDLRKWQKKILFRERMRGDESLNSFQISLTSLPMVANVWWYFYSQSGDRLGLSDWPDRSPQLLWWSAGTLRQSYEQSVIWYNNLFSDDSQACVDDKLLLTYLNQTQIENRAGWWGFSAPKSIKIYTAI